MQKAKNNDFMHHQLNFQLVDITRLQRKSTIPEKTALNSLGSDVEHKLGFNEFM